MQPGLFSCLLARPTDLREARALCAVASPPERLKATWPGVRLRGLFVLAGGYGTSLIIGALAPKFLPEFTFMLFEMPERTL